MRILHINNVAGIAVKLAYMQARHGHEPVVWVKKPHRYMYGHWTETVGGKKLFMRLIIGHSIDIAKQQIGLGLGGIIHLHGMYDWVAESVSRMPCVVRHLHGGDARRRGPRHYRGYVLVSTPDLQRFVRGESTWLPNPVFPSMFSDAQAAEKRVRRTTPRPLRIGCYGRNDKVMWGEFLESPTLSTAIRPIDIPHSSMPGFYRGIDVWVDKLGWGFYGVSAVEAAYMGIPVVAGVDKVFAKRYDIPFLRAYSICDVEDALLALSDSGFYAQKFVECREYALRLHNPDNVYRVLMRAYGDVVS